MSSLEERVRRLISVTSNESASTGAVRSAVAAIVEGAAAASPADLDAAVGALEPIIASAAVEHAALVALGAGALVERGGDPRRADRATMDRLTTVLSGIEAFVDQSPAGAPEWRSAAAMCLGAIAMLSHSVEARRDARQNPALHTAAVRLAPIHREAKYLEMLLDALDDEPIVVLHPAQRRGYKLALIDVTNNVELFILVCDALVGNPREGWLSGKRPTPSVVEALRGTTRSGGLPARYDCPFSFVAWSGLTLTKQLVEGTGSSATEHWLWMEGAPVDIPLFEGTRVVLLGTPPYPRILPATQTFHGCRPSVKVLEKLSEPEVEMLLMRIAGTAKR